jgi:hypothetical protein
VAITVDDAAEFLGFAPGTYDPVAVGRVVGAASAAISPQLIVDALSPDQQQTLDLARLRMVSELWMWQNTPTGQQVFADGTTIPQPVLRDAYWAVKPLLAQAGLVEWAGFA